MSSYIDAISQANTASTGGKEVSSTQDAVMGKEDFLSLLVAQLQNQDPLNPDEPTEFTAQLAQFSSLEQLFTLNDSMNTLVESNASSDRISTLGTIGKEVAYASSDFSFSGDPVQIGYQLDGTASNVDVLIKQNGAVLRSLSGTELTKGNHYLTWDGLTEDGEPAPVGDYTLVLQAKAASGETVAAAPIVRSEVTGVDLEGSGGGTLITKAGEVAFSSIYGVYEPGSRADSGTEESPDQEPQTASESIVDAVDSVTDAADAVSSLSEAVN